MFVVVLHRTIQSQEGLMPLPSVTGIFSMKCDEQRSPSANREDSQMFEDFCTFVLNNFFKIIVILH